MHFCPSFIYSAVDFGKYYNQHGASTAGNETNPLQDLVTLQFLQLLKYLCLSASCGFIIVTKYVAQCLSWLTIRHKTCPGRHFLISVELVWRSFCNKRLSNLKVGDSVH